MKKVKAPNGEILGFPDTMSDEAILDVMAEKFPAPFDAASFGDDYKAARKAIDKLPKKQRKNAIRAYAKYYVTQERKGGTALQTINDYVRRAGRNAPLIGEFADEGNAAWAALWGGDYELAHAAEQERRRQIDATRQPGVDLPWGLGRVDTGDIAKAGGLIGGTALAPASRVVTPFMSGTGSAARAGGNAAYQAAVTAGTDAAGRSHDNKEWYDRIVRGLYSAGMAAPMGYAAGHIFQNILNRARTGTFSAPRTADSPDDTLSRAQRAYRGSIDSSSGRRVTFTGAPMRRGGQRTQNPNLAPGATFADDVQDRVRRVLSHETALQSNYPRLHSVATEAQRFTGRAGMTLSEFEALRRMAVNISRESTSDNERRIAGRIVSTLDDMLGGIRSADVQGVSADTWRTIRRRLISARDTYRQGKKGQIVEEAIERALDRSPTTGAGTLLGGNIDNNIRQEIRRLINNPRTRRQFSPDEIEALQSVVYGAGPHQEALRIVGKLSPENIISATGAGALAYGVNPILGITAAVSGAAAKRTTNAITRANAEKIVRGITSGQLRRHLRPWHRAITAYDGTQGGRASLRAASIGLSNEFSRNLTMSKPEKEALFEAVFSEAIKQAEKQDTDKLFMETFRSKE